MVSRLYTLSCILVYIHRAVGRSGTGGVVAGREDAPDKRRALKRSCCSGGTRRGQSLKAVTVALQCFYTLCVLIFCIYGSGNCSCKINI